jgi:hypothetical protein
MRLLLTLGLMVCLSASGLVIYEASATRNSAKLDSSANPFVGHWTYRSFRNTADPVGDVQKDPSKLVALLFAEAEWVVEETKDGSFKGQLIFGPGEIMDLTGTYTPARDPQLAHLHVNGKGRPGTGTAALFYDYDGELALTWPNGVNQVPAIVGSVIRVKPHDGGPAGYVASFIAVKRNM